MMKRLVEPELNCYFEDEKECKLFTLLERIKKAFEQAGSREEKMIVVSTVTPQLCLEERAETHLRLSTTTALRILKAVMPLKRKAVTCIDEKLADVLEAFELADAFFDRLNEAQLVRDSIYVNMKERLNLAKSYLRGDFRVYLRETSRCGDYCLQFALSDPNGPYFLRF